MMEGLWLRILTNRGGHVSLEINFEIYNDEHLLDIVSHFKNTPDILWTYKDKKYKLVEGGLKVEDVVYYFYFVRWINCWYIPQISQWLKRGNKPEIRAFVNDDKTFGAKLTSIQTRPASLTNFLNFAQDLQKKLVSYSLIEFSNFSYGTLIFTVDVEKLIKRRLKYVW